MMCKQVLMLLVMSAGIFAGEQSTRTGQHRRSKMHRSQSGQLSNRGNKRNQKKMPTLEQFARDTFPGPDVQLGQKKGLTSSEKRKRSKAWQEAVLLAETAKTGSAEQCAAVEVLLKAKVHPDMLCLRECGISFQGSPVRNAAVVGNYALLSVLLKAGADASLPCYFSSKRGFGMELPIHAAARIRNDQTDFEGHYPKVITLLHEHGADVNKGGETPELPFAPIHLVALQRPQRGEDVSARTARQIAALRALIACNADLEKKTHNGDTAIDLALKRGNHNVAQFLGEILERLNRDKKVFVENFVAFQQEKGSPEGIRRCKKAAKAITKARHLKEKLKKQCGPASSSQCRDDY